MNTKQTLLRALLRADEPVSGQAVAKAAGVSRMAVSKAARELQREGWQVEALQGVGYRLLAGSDALTPDAILEALQNWPGAALLPEIQVVCEETLASTNETAKALALQGAPHATLVAAGEQTAGRGRLGRSFASPAGKGAYFTLLLRPPLAARDALRATGSAAVAVSRAVQRLCGKELQIKWVNDLFWEGKKTGGILTEASTNVESGQVDWLCIGIGLNLTATPEDFAPEVRALATSLFPGSPCPFSRASLIAGAAAELLQLSPGFDCLDEYRARCFVPGHWVTVFGQGAPWTARALEIDGRGRLLVERPNGVREALQFGEISVKPSVVRK